MAPVLTMPGNGVCLFQSCCTAVSLAGQLHRERMTQMNRSYYMNCRMPIVITKRMLSLTRFCKRLMPGRLKVAEGLRNQSNVSPSQVKSKELGEKCFHVLPTHTHTPSIYSATCFKRTWD